MPARARLAGLIGLLLIEDFVLMRDRAILGVLGARPALGLAGQLADAHARTRSDCLTDSPVRMPAAMLSTLNFPVRSGLLLALAAAATMHSLLAGAQPSGPSTAAATTPSAASASAAASAAVDPHRKQDVMRHRVMASAHEAAARCLETGEPESVCQERLHKACEGIAIGRYCGMKHGH